MHQTEQIKDSLNPDFRTAYTAEYWFEKKQDIKFVIIDGDGGGDYDIIGECVTTMGALMGAKAQTFFGELTHNGKKGGQLVVRGEALQESNQVVTFDLNLGNINNNLSSCMGICSETVNYKVEIQREVAGQNRFITVKRYPANQAQANTSFSKEILSIGELCNGNLDLKIQVQCITDQGQVLNSFSTNVGALGS